MTAIPSEHARLEMAMARPRHLTDRLPFMIAPRWLADRIQPIAIADVVHHRVEAAGLPGSHTPQNRGDPQRDRWSSPGT